MDHSAVWVVHPGQVSAGIAGLLSLTATGPCAFRLAFCALGGSGLSIITRWRQRRVPRVPSLPMLQIGDTRLETNNQRSQLGVFRRKSGVVDCQGGVLSHQAGALGQQFIAAIGSRHTNILTDLARSVVDYRALRA
jgi:hypothetical protein